MNGDFSGLGDADFSDVDFANLDLADLDLGQEFNPDDFLNDFGGQVDGGDLNLGGSADFTE